MRGNLSPNLSIQSLWPRRIAVAALFVAVGVGLSFGLLVIWQSAYGDQVDPKNIYYVLWKHGLNDNMNLDNALVAMSHDAWPARQVQGLTGDQLKARFGYTRTLGEVTPYYRTCYSTAASAGRAETEGGSAGAVFLRDSPWMVVLRNGKAVDLILCKGY